MKLLERRGFGRRELVSALRVAVAAAVFMGAAYGLVVAVLDLFVADHLTGQVDRQLTARLVAAVGSPRRAFSTTGVQTNGARYGLGIYGEPIRLWEFSTSGKLVRRERGDPPLTSAVGRPQTTSPSELDATLGGVTYRLEWYPTRDGVLLAGESLTELGHVEAVLAVSEAIALPFLLVAFFLVALAIGLRSAGPVETARRRVVDFTADASHELRTPLSVIEAEVSLARTRERSAAEYEETLERVGAESGRLRLIVEDLLWLARLDSEPEAPAREPVDLAAVALEAAERFRAMAAGRRQLIETVTPEAPGPIVAAPHGYLERLAGTLVDNACRYSGDESRVVVSALVSPERRAVLRIEDDGPGIPASARGDVLGRFRRATREQGGHGLGLAIADSVVQATGGRLEISRSPLGGAKIEASWPLQAAEKPTRRTST